jgi:hypothetical protein
MTITQTVEIPASHRLVVDVPREIPAGPVVLAFTPAADKMSVDQGFADQEVGTKSNRKPISCFFGTISPETYGDGVAYQRKIRDEWDD